MCKVITVQGAHSDNVKVGRMYMLGMYSMKPIWYELIEYGRCGSYNHDTVLPCRLLPRTKTIVESKLNIPDVFAQTSGALQWTRMQDLATELLMHSEDVPVVSDASKWRIYSCDFAWSTWPAET